MLPHRRRLLPLALLLSLLVAVLAPGAASAGIWSPVASGTSEDILAIEYQGEDRFWFTTANGKVFKRAGGGFKQVADAQITLNDIAFQPGGAVGLAVGQGGKVLRSTDAGETWSTVSGIQARNSGCNGSAALAGVTAVRFASGNRVYLFADGFGQIARSDDAGATWQDANRSADGTACRIRAVISDAFLPGPDVGYFMSERFGETYLSTDNLGTAALQGNGPNGFENVHRVVGDSRNQNRQWALTPETGNGSYFQRTETGWRSEDGWELINPGTMQAGYDLAFAGGTVLAAGDGGMILNSVDGRRFGFSPADGAQAGTAWRAVALASGTQGAVGGRGGALVLSSSANQVPSPPPPADFSRPTGTIGGPSAIGAGAVAAFSVNAADNAGGRGLDPASFTWTATGQSPVVGPAATFAWPAPGLQTVTVRFRDLAGNEGSATRTVEVAKGAATLPATAKPPVKIRTAGGKLKVTVKGKLKIPAGIPAAQGCRGNVIATVKKAKRLITARVIKLSKRCGFLKTITLRRSKVGRAKTLRVTLRLEGNQVIGTTRRTYTLKVPRR